MFVVPPSNDAEDVDCPFVQVRLLNMILNCASPINCLMAVLFIVHLGFKVCFEQHEKQDIHS